ncbi:uncharacterized protein LOC118740009 [Rhagoletis pomonella]|uniref:uncharacterized protein LOC118740009 n=1 Tax=Rhagoletis pomonella TaxID=28610 RepID=UPI001785A1B7|nr:uncharacterized protein LOC118740009 [Rhagoletis pomonella]
MPPQTTDNLESLVNFALEVQNVCASMKASGLQAHLNNPELEQKLVSKLPAIFQAFWGMHKLSLTESNLENFSKWLFQLAQGANSVIKPNSQKERKRAKIKDYCRKGYVRKLLPEEENAKKYWYLPVFPVVNPNKPNKVRSVWDAAAKVNGVSLNTVLLKGPDQLTSLLSILFKFRQRKIAIGGDIAEMFHQVLIRSEDQNYQRFLWYDPGAQQPTTYIMTVMTFGATCSPSSAQYVKNKNAERYSNRYPRATQIIVENHYVDDMLDSVDTEDKALQLAMDVRKIHAKGGFVIRNWVSNSKAVLKKLNAECTEGINLDIESDLATEKCLACGGRLRMTVLHLGCLNTCGAVT